MDSTVGVIGSQKTVGLCGFKGHILKKILDVTLCDTHLDGRNVKIALESGKEDS